MEVRELYNSEFRWTQSIFRQFGTPAEILPAGHFEQRGDGESLRSTTVDHLR
jgi:hypothetical protein